MHKMNTRPTTLEVLHDTAFERVDTAFIAEASAYVGTIACGGLVVEREAALNMHSDSESTPVRVANIRLGKRPVDITLILTPRPLQHSSAPHIEVQQSPIGTTLGTYTGSVIFMTTSGRQEILTTTAIHEIGHAMGLKRGGKTALKSDPHHCGLDYCVMYPRHSILPGIAKTEARTVRKWLFRSEHIPAQTHTFTHQAVFCNDCSEDLKRESYFEQLRRNGLPLH